MIDETSGNSGFHNPADGNEYSWPMQEGALSYEVARADSANFQLGCILFPETSDTSIVDPAVPALGNSFFYLNRPLSPSTGSWGQDSALQERVVSCE